MEPSEAVAHRRPQARRPRRRAGARPPASLADSPISLRHRRRPPGPATPSGLWIQVGVLASSMVYLGIPPGRGLANARGLAEATLHYICFPGIPRQRPRRTETSWSPRTQEAGPPAETAHVAGSTTLVRLPVDETSGRTPCFGIGVLVSFILDW